MATYDKRVIAQIETACRQAAVRDVVVCRATIKDQWTPQTNIQREVDLYKKSEEEIPPEAQCMNPWEWKLFRDLNAWRARLVDEYQKFGHSKKKAQPFKIDCDLVRAARLHSQDLALHHPVCDPKNGCDPHLNSEGKDPHQRIREATGNRYRLTAENVARGGLIVSLTNITSLQNDFITEHPPGKLETHRANILDPRLTSIGIGVYLAPTDGQIFITQDFGGYPEIPSYGATH